MTSTPTGQWFVDVVPGREPGGTGSSSTDGGVALVAGPTPTDLRPLNLGRSVAFAPAEGKGVRQTRHVVDARLAALPGGGFELLARVVDADGHGDPDRDGRVLVLGSTDLLTFHEAGWRGRRALPEPGPVRVDAGVARALHGRYGRYGRYGPIVNTGIEVRDLRARPGSTVDLRHVTATLTYSDGSTTTMPVDWDTPTPTVGPAGHLTEVWGWARSDAFPFPFVAHRADPCITRFDGAWLYVATDDSGGDNQSSTHLALRRAPTLEGLRDAAEHTIVAVSGETGIAGCFWASELHDVGGRLTLFFAPSLLEPSWARVRCHVTQLRPGGDPTDAADWDTPREVRRRDGSPLQLAPDHPGISLDMTYAHLDGRHYVVWSERTWDDEEPEPALWIATLDPAAPDRLTSDPVRLLRPDWPWQRRGAAVVEGPYVLVRGTDVWLAYSAAGVGPHYAVGLLQARLGDDLTDPTSWRAHMPAAVTADPAIGRWGPGHGTFTTTADGTTLHVHHAKGAPHEPSRHTAVTPVHFAADGHPVLDMRQDERLAPAHRRVAMRVIPHPLEETAP